MSTNYRSFEIVKDINSVPGYCCMQCHHIFSSGLDITFKSDWYEPESFNEEDAVRAVKARIDAYINALTETVPKHINFKNFKLSAAFNYYGFNPIKISLNREEICEFIHKYFDSDGFKDIGYQISMTSSWIEYFKDYEQWHFDVTNTNKKTNAKEILIYGVFVKAREYGFTVTYNDSDHIEIAVEDESCEEIADEIARMLNIYESKEFALSLKELD